MPDDEGFSLPGELNVGSYGALEGDLGEKLTWPLGFGRLLDDGEGAGDDETCETVFAPGGFVTGAFSASGVRYVSPDQLETWRAVWGR